FDRRGEIVEVEGGHRLLFDDNTSPVLTFCWAAQRKKGPDIQFNHVYGDSRNPSLYTALWNLCVTPAFLAKTTDGTNHPEVIAALRRRSFDLFGSRPQGEPEPEKPAGYDELVWADSPPPVANLESILRARLRAASKSRPAIAAREIGWLYSGWRPDATV
ncbi:MAG: hypothetical protein GY773_16115, partial [Actinomycetia bacterium]|nr:hypothetical protein [Actinomycetes bacterium]